MWHRIHFCRKICFQTHLTFGREFTEAVEMKQVAQQEAERARYVVERVSIFVVISCLIWLWTAINFVAHNNTPKYTCLCTSNRKNKGKELPSLEPREIPKLPNSQRKLCQVCFSSSYKSINPRRYGLCPVLFANVNY